ncbi:uncharacterized protein LOC134530603 [Bacillus rossius redtenbacheri]|uniref:uncharacterized protein LOC134530603 n=1 Tax=Bacillus rossius redtenbacheri TaxID=93214 RepID=UPI002FDD08F8
MPGRVPARAPIATRPCRIAEETTQLRPAELTVRDPAPCSLPPPLAAPERRRAQTGRGSAPMKTLILIATLVAAAAVAPDATTPTSAGEQADPEITSAEEAIKERIEALLRELEELHKYPRATAGNASLGEESPIQDSSITHPDLNGTRLDANTMNTSETMNENYYFPNGTAESYAAATEMFVERKPTDLQTENMASPSKHEGQVSPKDADETVMDAATGDTSQNSVGYKNATEETPLVANADADARPRVTERTSAGDSTQFEGHLMHTTTKSTKHAKLQTEAPDFVKENAAVKNTSEPRKDVITNDGTSPQINFSETMPIVTRLGVVDAAGDSPATSTNKKAFHKKRNHLNETKRVESKNDLKSDPAVHTPGVEEPATRRTQNSGELVEDRPTETPRGSQEARDVDTAPLLDAWPELVGNATEAPVSDGTMRAVQELFPFRSALDSMAVVVEKSEGALQRARAILRGVADEETIFDGQLLLVTYDDEVTATRCGRAELRALAGKLHASDGSRWAALEAVLEAARRARPGGGVLLLAARRPSDRRLALPAAGALRAKRLKLHVVWCGQRSLGDEAPLRDLSWASGGSFLAEDDLAAPTAGRPPQLVTLVMHKGLYGSSKLAIPVDSSLQSVDVTIRGPVSSAVMHDPAGRATDLQTLGAATLSDGDSLLAARLDTRGAAPGVWTLAVLGAGVARYDVTARAASPLGFTAEPGEGEVGVLLRGGVAAVSAVSALDRSGGEVARLDYTRAAPSRLAVADHQLPAAAAYLRLSGSDRDGKTFQRVSYLPQQTTTGTVSPIELDVALNSTLYALPGQTAQIIYTVTNNQELTNYIDFSSSSQHFSTSVQPESFQLAAHQTVYILVTVTVPQNIPQNTEDVITLAAIYGPNSGISKTVYFTVGQKGSVSDNEKPTISYRVDSDCGSLDTSDCQLKIWRAEVVIQDKQSGLLQVASQPKGLRLRSTFVAGTRELVGAYYSATCCDRSVVVTATDARGNFTQQTITATAAGQLSSAATAGIVVGILLFLIIIIIAAVVVARRSRQKSVSFPQSTES